MRNRLKLRATVGALICLAAGTATAQLPSGSTLLNGSSLDGVGLTGSGSGLASVDTSALGSTLLHTGSDGVVAATAGTPLASMGVATTDTVSGAGPLLTLPLAYVDFVFFDGPVPLPRVFPDSPVDLLAPLINELDGSDGARLPGLGDLPQVSIVPRLDPLSVPIPQVGQALDQ